MPLCSQTPEQLQLASSWCEIKSIIGKIASKCHAVTAAARSHEKPGAELPQPPTTGLERGGWRIRNPEPWFCRTAGGDTGDVDRHSHLQSNSVAKPTPTVGCEKERCGLSHPMGLGERLLSPGCPFGEQKRHRNKIRKANKTPVQGREGAEGSSPEACPWLRQGSLLGFGWQRTWGLSPSSAWGLKDEPRRALHSYPRGMAEAPSGFTTKSLCLQGMTARAEDSHQRSSFQPVHGLLPGLCHPLLL